MANRRRLDDRAQLLGDGHCGVERRHRQQQHEFLAADARQEILGPFVAREQIRDAGDLIPLSRLFQQELRDYANRPHAHMMELGMLFYYLLRFREDTRTTQPDEEVQRAPFRGRPRMAMRINSAGNILYIYQAGNTIDLYDTASFKLLRTITLDGDMTSFTLLPPNTGVRRPGL